MGESRAKNSIFVSCVGERKEKRCSLLQNIPCCIRFIDLVIWDKPNNYLQNIIFLIKHWIWACAVLSSEKRILGAVPEFNPFKYRTTWSNVHSVAENTLSSSWGDRHSITFVCEYLSFILLQIGWAHEIAICQNLDNFALFDGSFWELCPHKIILPLRGQLCLNELDDSLWQIIDVIDPWLVISHWLSYSRSKWGACYS